MLALVSLIAIGGTVFSLKQSNDTQETTTDAAATKEKVNYNPPSSDELKETEARKEEIIKSTDPSPSGNPNDKTIVTPIITNASQDDVRAFIPSISEDGGECSAIFSQGQNTFTKKSPAFKNGNSTNCEPINLNRSDFISSGKWSVFINYNSNYSEGKSSISTFEVTI